MNKDPNVLFAEPNYLRYMQQSNSNDPLLKQQYSHRITQAEKAWEIESGSEEIVIAIIDSGVDYNHEDLGANIWINGDEIPDNGIDDDENSYIDDIIGFDTVNIDEQFYLERGYNLIDGEDYFDPDSDPMDFGGHGTHVAGIVAAVGDNGIGISGICQRCKIMPLRAGFQIEKRGGLNGLLTDTFIIELIYYAVDNGANIISMSFGGGPRSESMNEAINYAKERNVLLVAASGNSDVERSIYPANYEGVLSITSTNEVDSASRFTNYGISTDIAAPGEDILSTVLEKDYSSGYAYKSGTSMSTPYVSGLIGLLLSHRPDLTRYDVERMLKLSADPPNEDIKYIGEGRVNALNLLNQPKPTVAQAIIDYPGFHPIKELIDIHGSALGDSYTLKLGEGIYPSSYETIFSGTSISDGIIGSIDFANKNPGRYSIKLEISDNDGPNFYTVKPLYLGTGELIQNGWPYICEDCNGEGFNVVTAFDLDDNGYKEILSTDKLNLQIVTNYNGEELFRYRHHIANPLSIIPSISDQSIFALSTDTSTLKILNINGNVIEEKRILSGSPMKNPITSDDLNNDGLPEYIILAYDYSIDKTTPYKVVILNDNLETTGQYPLHNELNEKFSPVVGDLEGDGEKEIVFVARDENNFRQMYVINMNGEIEDFGITENTPWPKELIFDSNIGSIRSNQDSVYLADIDGDGDLEIVHTSLFSIHVWNHDGTYLEGFPTMDNPINNNKLVAISDLAIGNLDEDEELEFFGTSDSLYHNRIEIPFGEVQNAFVIDNDGSIIHPTLNGYYFEGPFFTESPGKPLIGNLDQDEENKVLVLTEEGFIHAWNLDGSFVEGFPITIPTRIDSFPTIDDIDNDGDTDLLIGGKQFILAYDLDAAWDPDKIEWPTYQHDVFNTGNYDFEHIDTRIFTRGEVNGDGDINMADAIFMINAMFLGSKTIHCEDAMDVNDDGFLDLSDPVYLLNYLFIGGPEIKDPFFEEGYDQTEDELIC